ncbi:hypothetical protein IQ230_23495 [Gloeocapsopsis crepidinum LEGE 06123]|uniref:Uncharacterized protein n=1 Tax=Gloeocapsopsis crepidinum LEGE 06123 TaxID=588587 RepID=A0ABR9V0A8_9CHRO|nr:hypothetical protein [Gloeocapsopsis crepidinum]MBE9193255.1 hypothetical protein [Gloeocapsopsis crepidinum LEGE 06123]
MWKPFFTIRPTKSWQFTPAIEAQIFRLRHLNPPISPIGFIAQAELASDGLYQFYDVKRLNGLTPYECLVYVKPIFFSDRVLAFRQDYRTANNWNIVIEYTTQLIVINRTERLATKLNDPGRTLILAVI